MSAVQSPPKLTEQVLQAATSRYARWQLNHEVVITNEMGILRHEADLMSVTNAGIVHEFEIKISSADFKREFEKKQSKHHDLTRAHLKNTIKRGVPNYFWIVSPKGMIDPQSVPSYCGHIEYTWRFVDGWEWSDEEFDHWHLRHDVMRRAPRLHRHNHFRENPENWRKAAFYASRRVGSLLSTLHPASIPVPVEATLTR